MNSIGVHSGHKNHVNQSLPYCRRACPRDDREAGVEGLARSSRFWSGAPLKIKLTHYPNFSSTLALTGFRTKCGNPMNCEEFFSLWTGETFQANRSRH